MEKIRVLGSKIEQIHKLLELAGWYENRSTNISKVEKYYKLSGIEMFDSIKEFYKEFYGIARSWYIKFEYPKSGADFEFCLFPDLDKHMGIKDYMFDDAEYKIPSEDYINISYCAKEEFAMIGKIGYYYSAEAWMGKSGELYTTHEYDEHVYTFPSIFDLIEHELRTVEIDTVMVKK